MTQSNIDLTQVVMGGEYTRTCIRLPQNMQDFISKAIEFKGGTTNLGKLTKQGAYTYAANFGVKRMALEYFQLSQSEANQLALDICNQ